MGVQPEPTSKWKVGRCRRFSRSASARPHRQALRANYSSNRTNGLILCILTWISCLSSAVFASANLVRNFLIFALRVRRRAISRVRSIRPIFCQSPNLLQMSSRFHSVPFFRTNLFSNLRAIGQLATHRIAYQYKSAYGGR